MLESIVNWLAETIFRLGYPGIVLLMAIESSIFPLPSEVVMPPAGYLAAQGRMNPWIAVAAGTIGSLLGAAFNYFIALRLGRPFLYRYGRYLLVSERSLKRSESFFNRHGEISTFVGRLVPVVRHLISIPAGLARMRLHRFAAYTSLGAAIWCAILTYIGWYVGRHSTIVELSEILRSPQFRHYSTVATLILLPVLALVVIWYVLRHRRRPPQTTADPEQGT